MSVRVDVVGTLDSAQRRILARRVEVIARLNLLEHLLEARRLSTRGDEVGESPPRALVRIGIDVELVASVRKHDRSHVAPLCDEGAVLRLRTLQVTHALAHSAGLR